MLTHLDSIHDTYMLKDALILTSTIQNIVKIHHSLKIQKFTTLHLNWKWLLWCHHEDYKHVKPAVEVQHGTEPLCIIMSRLSYGSLALIMNI